MDNNLIGTINLLEYAKRHTAGVVLMSTSRVYSINRLVTLPLVAGKTRFEYDATETDTIPGFSQEGIAENFSTEAPLSLYGGTKRASEVMALEYANAFNFPVWINRCGVIGGPGQLGKIDQGIFSFWVYSCAMDRKLQYIGFGGSGKQVRDCVLAEDVADLVIKQMGDPGRIANRVLNVGGGNAGALSLLELTKACEKMFRKIIIVERTDQERSYDIPYYVTDIRKADEVWGWKPSCDAQGIVERIHAWSKNNMPFIRELFK